MLFTFWRSDLNLYTKYNTYPLLLKIYFLELEIDDLNIYRYINDLCARAAQDLVIVIAVLNLYRHQAQRALLK